MNRTKKLISLLTAVLMFFATGINVMAEDDSSNETTYTFVVEQEVDEALRNDYEYQLYQMFTGDIISTSSGYVISNIEWGSSVKEDTKTSLYTLLNLPEGKRNAAGVAEWIKNQGEASFHTLQTLINKSDGSSLDPYAQLAYGNYTVNGVEKTGYGKSGLIPGYYLVRNTKVPQGENYTYSDYIVEMVGGDVVAKPKVEIPSSDKKTVDVNDSYIETQENQETGDYDIGDMIPFVLTATLPQNFDKYTSGYRLIFIDDISAGLTWDGKAMIYFGANDTQGTSIHFNKVTNTPVPAEEGTITVKSSYANGEVWAYDISNIKLPVYSSYGLKSGDVITIRYNATLNSNARVDNYGNRNKYHVNYSNNPTDYQKVGSTPDKENIIFTYKTVFNKTDENGTALKGADFKLEKFVFDANGSASITVEEKTVKGYWLDVTVLHSGTGAVNPSKTTDTTGTKFTFSGLDDGVYRLTETVTPRGYNTIEPVQFTISATHDSKDGLSSLSGTDGGEFVMEPNLTAGSLETSIKNQSGIILPSTGGIGTTIFYVLGGILVAGAGILLITKKRMQ